MKYYYYTYSLVLNKLSNNEMPKLKFKIWSYIVTFFCTWQFCFALFYSLGTLIFGRGFSKQLTVSFGDSRNEIVFLIITLPIVLFGYFYSQTHKSEIESMIREMDTFEHKKLLNLKIKLALFHISLIVFAPILIYSLSFLKKAGIIQ